MTEPDLMVNLWRYSLTLDSESRFAGSAGTVNSTVRVSTAMTPRGIPPNLFLFNQDIKKFKLKI